MTDRAALAHYTALRHGFERAVEALARLREELEAAGSAARRPRPARIEIARYVNPNAGRHYRVWWLE